MPSRQISQLVAACGILTLCLSSAVRAEDTAASRQIAPSLGELVFKYLVGEVAGQRGEPGLAGDVFLDLAKTTRDPRLAERAAKAALYANRPVTAIQAANLWAELDPNSVEAQQASAQMLVATGRLKEAKPYLQKLLAPEKTRAEGFMYLSSILARNSDRNAVLSLVQELAQPYPNLPEAHFAVAHSALSAGNADLASSELAAADKVRPGWEAAALLQGQVLSGRPEQAVDYYRTFLKRYPAASEVRLNLARLLVNLRRFDEARTEFVQLVSGAQGNPEILVVVGLLSFQAGELGDAEKYFQQALKANFKDPNQIYLYLGQIAENQHRDEQALAWYNKVTPGDRYLQAKLDIASVTARMQGVDAGIKQLDSLQELTNEQQVSVIQAKASLLGQAKRYSDAYDLLASAVSQLPNTPDLIYDYAMSAERVQKLDVMERELRKLIQLKPDFAQAYNALGYTLADRNQNLEEARSLIEKALSLSPDDHFILDSMGWVEYRMGKLDQAADFLRRAYASQTDPEIAAHLGEVLWQQGKYDEAMQTWDNALREHPENEVLVNTAKKFKR